MLSVNQTPLKLTSDDTIVVAFGRFNPPTHGHEKLMDKVLNLAKENNCRHRVLTSHSHCIRNPLEVDMKTAFLKLLFPEIWFDRTSNNEPSIFHVLKRYNESHKRLIYVCGSDRIGRFKKILNKYNGIDYNFAYIEVVGVDRNENDVSATSARYDAIVGDFTSFRECLPSKLFNSLADSTQLYNKIRNELAIFGTILRNDYE